ncbi:hypothetical protein DKM44_05870 [Deinococcus irradiatisoli]|uniref:SnoaL-like domain-containing protein n=1 Tax=Deinococcus irradiatisoli TaxID=2202254 RepID=A0A2Z3JIM7_9DEIO|nr:nuclear transport factor 2 family protein [Deinococcus irradiatisoli]AWN22809.1 hypothetical protein DKM44_05870 [Deinococcus irradiatisoli]
MDTPLHDLIQQTFRSVERKELNGVLSLLADDAVFTDPHYPDPVMRGKAEIEAGLRWGFSSMKQFGFTIVRFFDAPDRQSAAVEVATHHVLKGGMNLRFPQMFVIETRNGKITRLQAFEPYGPNGIGGAVLSLTRLVRRVKRLSQSGGRRRTTAGK